MDNFSGQTIHLWVTYWSDQYVAVEVPAGTQSGIDEQRRLVAYHEADVDAVRLDAEVSPAASAQLRLEQGGDPQVDETTSLSNWPTVLDGVLGACTDAGRAGAGAAHVAEEAALDLGHFAGAVTGTAGHGLGAGLAALHPVA